MTEQIEELSDALLDEMAAAAVVDPRTIPTRHSLLKQMSLSPAHYWTACQAAQDHDTLAARLGSFTTDRKEALRFGTAVHEMLLGDSKKIGRYKGRRAGKAWDTFQEEAADAGCVVILNEREWTQASRVVDAIRARGDAMRLLLDGTTVEQRIDWEWMSRAVRSTPDARCKRYTVDLKTAVSSEPETFKRQSRRLFYHCQAELYARAMEANGEGTPEDAYLIVVEKSEPMPVTIFRFTAEMLHVGAKQNRLWIERLLQCEAANHWPPYAPEPAIVDLDVDEPEGWAA